ncbi:MAG: tripartite tricarboxylate transporter substrate binding protein [Burkholderiales bacterium]|jgi:tripartite-type tricarboxylate transporter receptor subunit TctC|nr:tripartite tricarboxylate transporter substrate binding protein [Burkholderiales bacterium]
MSWPRRCARRFAVLGAVLGIVATALSAPLVAEAQSGWPQRPIRFVMTAPPGSSIDVLGRTIADKLKDRLGQPVVVENLPAAGGTAGTAAVAKAAPDGYTMGLAFNGPLAFAPFLYDRLPYDPQRDLAPVILASSQPNVLAVSADFPAKTVAEFIDVVRRNPGKYNYASVGNGSSSHLTMELLKSAGGLYIVHIPFNGAPPAAASVAAGDTQMLFAVPTAINPHVKSGKVRALAVTSSARFPLMPELPTLAESGLKGFDASAWNGIVVPAGTPREIVERLNREVNAILRDPDVKARLNAAGLEPVGGTPEDFGRLIRSEADRWAPVVKRTGAKID